MGFISYLKKNRILIISMIALNIVFFLAFTLISHNRLKNKIVQIERDAAERNRAIITRHLQRIIQDDESTEESIRQIKGEIEQVELDSEERQERIRNSNIIELDRYFRELGL